MSNEFENKETENMETTSRFNLPEGISELKEQEDNPQKNVTKVNENNVKEYDTLTQQSEMMHQGMPQRNDRPQQNIQSDQNDQGWQNIRPQNDQGWQNQSRPIFMTQNQAGSQPSGKEKQNKKQKNHTPKTKKQHGIIYKGVSIIASAAIFGVVALGTIYVGGDKLGIINTNSTDNHSKNTKVTSTKVTSSGDNKQTIGLSSVASGSQNQTIVSDVSDVVQNVMPSIVAITSTQMVQSVYSNWWGFYGSEDEYQEQTGAGSGIIIGQNDTELLVVTNNHVVEGADSLQVQFIDDETVDAYIKGTNYDNDLAVVSIKLSDIKKSTLDSIKIATLGNSDELKVGEGTIAIGNALGYGQSVTTGVVSALNREVEYEDRTMTLIQTDAAINPGNSGGALLNTKGEVIGINAAKYSSSSVEGMGFAIPVSEVTDIIEDLMSRETLMKVDPDKKGYINIKGRDVTEELAAAYDAPVGVLVVEVIEKGAAEKAGIEKSDIITAINGDKVTSMKELQEKLEYYEKGTTVTLTVQYLQDKEYVEKEVEITLGGSME
ncbi:MAG: trypsin-like peptidase domain-containing protein [Lachnospiraceae bacterium]|nr:trypsin-like peptidase domain-containing protein [Lachnospiraceae bacterium]